jgi:transcription elongation factor GreA
MEAQIRRLQEALRDPEIIEAPVDADVVAPHMLVTVRPVDDPDDEEEVYLLAEHGEEKAPGARTVTTSSPLGTALIGASKDQEVLVEAPGGRFRYRVVGFEPFLG